MKRHRTKSAENLDLLEGKTNPLGRLEIRAKHFPWLHQCNTEEINLKRVPNHVSLHGYNLPLHSWTPLNLSDYRI